MQTQIEFYESKLAYEMDPVDLFEALENSTDYVVIDARQAEPQPARDGHHGEAAQQPVGAMPEHQESFNPAESEIGHKDAVSRDETTVGVGPDEQDHVRDPQETHSE